jgi:hypothetical protein
MHILFYSGWGKFPFLPTSRKSIKNSKAPLACDVEREIPTQETLSTATGTISIFEPPPTAPVNRWLGGDGRHNEEALSGQGRVIIDKRP